MARGPFTPEELKILRANSYTLRAELDISLKRHAISVFGGMTASEIAAQHSA